MPQAPVPSNDAGSVCDAPLSTAALVPNATLRRKTHSHQSIANCCAATIFLRVFHRRNTTGGARCTGLGIAPAEAARRGSASATGRKRGRTMRVRERGRARMRRATEPAPERAAAGDGRCAPKRIVRADSVDFERLQIDRHRHGDRAVHADAAGAAVDFAVERDRAGCRKRRPSRSMRRRLACRRRLRHRNRSRSGTSCTEPGSDLTLCGAAPPALVQVTVSPAAIFKVDGENVNPPLTTDTRPGLDDRTANALAENRPSVATMPNVIVLRNAERMIPPYSIYVRPAASPSRSDDPRISARGLDAADV